MVKRRGGENENKVEPTHKMKWLDSLSRTINIMIQPLWCTGHRNSWFKSCISVPITYLIRNTQHRGLDGFHSTQVSPKSSQYGKYGQIKGMCSGHSGIPALSQFLHWGPLAAVLKAASRLLQTLLKTKPVSERFQNKS